MSRHADEATVRRWFDAFNSRDLEAMLACMDAHVDFRPLRLDGVDSIYHCHLGVRIWFEDMEQMEHRHRVELSEVRASDEDKVIAAGTLSAPDPAVLLSFWAVKHFGSGLIITAEHYTSDRFHLR